MRVRVRTDFLNWAYDGRKHQGLVANAEFYVIEANDNSYRVINAQGEPILYPRALFDVTNCSVHSGWQFRAYDDGEYFLEPATLAQPGFYEAWFGSDGDRALQRLARRALREELVRLLQVVDETDRILLEEALGRLPSDTT